MTPQTWRLAAFAATIALAGSVFSGIDAPFPTRAGLALFAAVGVLWLTQALPLAVTALLVPLAAVLLGLLDVRAALAPFAHPIVFLFLGGFVLAAALQQQGLDRALAGALLRAAGGRPLPTVLLLLAATALLSMWISNTATAAMMLPLALGLLDRLAPDAETVPERARTRAFVLLGLAYSASIGGIGTVVGSPPNAIAAAHAGIGFAEWMRIGLPMVALLWPLMLLVLWAMLRPRFAAPGGNAWPLTDGTVAFAWTAPRLATLAVFALTAAGWVGAAPLAQALGVGADIDSLVALAAIVALAALRLVDWDAAEQRVQWGVLLLFGGGLALGAVMERSGASRFLADAVVAGLAGASTLVLLIGVVTFVVALTELVSNTASAALLVPVFGGVGAALGLPPLLLAAGIAVAASCAFMLPVATPPNAIVYGSRLVPQRTMVRCGLVLNGVCIVAIVAVLEAVVG